MKITDAQAAKLKDENPGAVLTVIDIDDLDLQIVVRTGDDKIAGIYKRLKAQIGEEQQKAAATRTFAFSCVVFPPGEEFAALAARMPGLVDTISNRLLELVGAGLATSVRKL